MYENKRWCRVIVETAITLLDLLRHASIQSITENTIIERHLIILTIYYIATVATYSSLNNLRLLTSPEISSLPNF